MKRTLRSTLVLPTLVLVFCGAGGLSAQCSASARLGLGGSPSRLPNGEDAELDLSVGLGGGLGFDCGSTVRLGVDAEFQSLGTLLLGYVVGTVGLQQRLDSRERSSWVRVAGHLGIASVSEIVDGFPLLSPGRQLELPSTALALGSSVRVGWPLGGRSSVFVDVSLRAVFLPTAIEFGLGPGETATLLTFPVQIGYRLRL